MRACACKLLAVWVLLALVRDICLARSFVSESRSSPNCPAAASLQQRSDRQTCTYIADLAADPFQGCPSTTRLDQSASRADLSVAQQTATLKAIRHSQADSGDAAFQLCCRAAKLFVSLHCHCCPGIQTDQAEALVRQSMLCGSLPTPSAATNIVDSLGQRRLKAHRKTASFASAFEFPQQQRDQTDGSSNSSLAPAHHHAAALPLLPEQHHDDIRLFVAVLTAAANRANREAIRATWGGSKQLRRLLFISAMPRDKAAFDQLRREAVQHQDLLIVPHVLEHYTNITHQTFEACRAAALDPQMTHFLKVDDDTFVRVGPLLARLQAAPRQHLYLGFIENPGGRPRREPNSKWFVSRAEWPDIDYPPWAHGPGYVLTADLVREISAGAPLKLHNGTLFRLEDIALASWIQYIAKEQDIQVQKISDKRFNYDGCTPFDLISHYISADMMRCAYAMGGRCCDKAQAATYVAGVQQQQAPGQQPGALPPVVVDAMWEFMN